MDVNILDVLSNKLVNAEIKPASTEDFNGLQYENRFTHFSWKELQKTNHDEVFKLERNGTLLGLIQFFNEKMLLQTIEITKLEVAIENVGAKKKFDYIAGCLIAFACLEALKLTGELFLFYTKDTKKNYLAKYGMTSYSDFYVISNKENCKQLVLKYLGLQAWEKISSL